MQRSVLNYASPPPHRGLGRAGPVAVVATVWPILGSVTVVALAPFVAPWLREQGSAGVGYFVVTLALLGAVAFAPTNATAAVAGWAFGFVTGWLAMLAATIVGAVACYGAARTLAGKRVAETFREHPKWELVRRAFVEASLLKTFWLVALLRLSPVLPFGTTNILLATTGVRLAVYVAGTLIGLAPRAALVTFAAARTEQFDPAADSGVLLLATGLAATLVCLMVLVVLGRRALRRATADALN